MSTTTKVPELELNIRVARRLGYNTAGDAMRAAVRAFRWLKNPRNFQKKAPSHIQEKMGLLKFK